MFSLPLKNLASEKFELRIFTLMPTLIRFLTRHPYATLTRIRLLDQLTRLQSAMDRLATCSLEPQLPEGSRGAPSVACPRGAVGGERAPDIIS